MKHQTRNTPFKFFATCLFLSLATQASALPVQYSFDVFGIPGEGYMAAYDINDSNDIVGNVDSFATGSRVPSGFVRRNGNFEIITAPGAEPFNGTAAYGINNNGDVVGRFTTLTAGQMVGHGYLLRNGVFEEIDVANSSFTEIMDISNRGELAGRTFLDASPNQGTAFTALNGVFDFYAPDNVLGSFGISFNGVNDFGNTVGRVLDNNGFGSFAILNGIYTPFSIPGANKGSTTAMGINNLNQIVGMFSNSKGYHGFLMDESGIFQIDFPNMAFEDTFIFGLNNLGSLVGAVSQPRFPASQALVATPCQQAGPDCFEMPRIGDAVIKFPTLVAAPTTLLLSLVALLMLPFSRRVNFADA